MIKFRFSLVFLFVLLVVAATVSSFRDGRNLDLSRRHKSHSVGSRHPPNKPKLLFRIHRQAGDDSYEEGGDGEYEYEEEEETPRRKEEEEKPETESEVAEAKHNEAEDEEEEEERRSSSPKPSEAKGDEREEYYDGDYENEKEEDEEEEEEARTSTTSTTTSTTTTTTTTPEPPRSESMEQIEDEDHYEERYEEERRRYEQETLRRQYENTHGTEVESVEESPEERNNGVGTATAEESYEPENDAENVAEETSTTSTSTTTPEPEKEAEEVSGELDSKNPTVEPVEIEESGRVDLERYSEPKAEDVEQEVEEEEYEEEEIEEPLSTTTTSTTTSTTTTTPKPEEEGEEEEFYGGKRDPDDYEVEQPQPEPPITEPTTTTTPTPPPTQPTNGEEDEEEEYYEEEKSEELQTTTTTSTTTTIPTTTSTTTTPEPDPEKEIPSSENEIESNERGHYDFVPLAPTPPPHSEEEIEKDEEEEMQRPTHAHPAEHENEIEEEEEIEPSTTTTTTSTTQPPPTTTFTTTTTTVPPTTTRSRYNNYRTETRPYDPDPEDNYDEDDDDDDEDSYDIFTTPKTTTTTTTTTTPPPPSPSRPFRPLPYEEDENSIFSEHERPLPPSAEDEEEEEEENEVDRARNQYEIPSAPLPTERVVIEEIRPKIECFSGYVLSRDGQECVDDNECERSNVCGPLQICRNLPGSYKCECLASGFILDPRNPKNCRDFNECQVGNGGCDQDCINVSGSFRCACADEFELGSDGKRCIRRPTTTTTTTTTTTSTTTTTPKPTTTMPPTAPPLLTTPPTPTSDDLGVRNCPTPPVPRGTGIAYLYCSRSPVGIHHRHSQLERRLLHDWAARRNRTQLLQDGGSSRRYANGSHRYPRSRRNLLKRKLRQTTYSPGSLCELRCRPGFELKGQYTLHCNASDGSWYGGRNGFCQAIPKSDSSSSVVSESTPSNEIPRLGSEVSGPQFRPSFVQLPTTQRPLQPPSRAQRPEFRQPTTTSTTTSTTTTPPPPTTTITTTTTPTPLPPSTITYSWTKPQGVSRRPYYFSPSTPYTNYYGPRPSSPRYFPSTTTTTSTTTSPTTTTHRNSYIHLTYRFKTPWIKCPEDIRLDLPPNQNSAYVIIPQPQTNVDWWRQVTAEPSWAKGLESESGPGKQRITFRARTAAAVNNTAECSFTLEIRDNEPPRARECPESFSTRLGAGQNARPVSWIEPHFSDNVKITGLQKSHEPGVVLSLGEHFVNYEARDESDNKAKCSFTITVLPPLAPPVAAPASNYGKGQHQTQHIQGYHNHNSRRPADGTSTSTSTSPKPEVHSSLRNVVCHVGKKGRRIVFQSRVVPRGCSEMSVELAGDASSGQFNGLNTITQNSAENSATSQISSVSFSTHDHPQAASAFSQSISNGRNSNRLVHSSSSVTNGAHGTSSKSSSYAIAVSSSSRNFDLPSFIPEKIGDDEDFVVPSQSPPPGIKTRSGYTSLGGSTREESGLYRLGSGSFSNNNNSNNNNSNNLHIGGKNSSSERKYFRHFDTWDTTTDSYGNVGNRL